jgi:hypothetical protein
MTKTNKVVISERALLRRLNRYVKDRDQQVKKAREGPDFHTIGPYFILIVSKNAIGLHGLELWELVALARKLDVLAKWEGVEGA